MAGGSRLWVPAVARPFAERLVADVLRVLPGETCLDMPCGWGVLAAVMAGAAGPEGTVLAIDADPEARRACAEEVATLRLASVEVGATAPGGGVDAAGSLLTLAHRDRPAAILAEVATALRPGGRLAAASWGGGAGASPITAVAAALDSADAGAPAPLRDALRHGGPGGLEDLAAAAGLGGAEVLRPRDVARFNGPDHLLAAVAGLCGVEAELDGLSDQELAAVLDHLAVALRPFTAWDGTLVIPVELAVLRWTRHG